MFGWLQAKTSGIAVVGLTNYASATGALGVWTRDMARQGLVGIVMSQVCLLPLPLCPLLLYLYCSGLNLSSCF